jgi:hypothetical protein
MGTSHLVQEMVTWRHRSISSVTALFTKSAREVAKLLPSDKSDSTAARKTHSASTGFALEQISGFGTSLMLVFC